MTHISGSRLIPGSVQREKQFIIDFVFNYINTRFKMKLYQNFRIMSNVADSCFIC